MNAQLQTQAKARTNPSVTPASGGLLQRKCACGSHTIAGSECQECREKDEARLQRAAVNSERVQSVPPIVHEVLQSPGQPLDTATRTFFKPRFGHDFSRVRVHTDAKAAESAQAVNALAYTMGQHLVFGTSQYMPATVSGRRLLAHELTHVLQQRETLSLQKAAVDEITNRENDLEKEADAIASDLTTESVLAGEESSDLTLEDDLAATDETELKTPTEKPPAKPKKPKPKPNPCTRTILSEGSCADLVKGSKYRCCDPDKGIENPARDKDIEGKECPSHKFTPQFTCEKHCEDALSKGCDDNDNWIAIPGTLKSVLSQCGDIFTICANGKQTPGYVRDRSETKQSFEVSPGILTKLGVPLGSSFKGAVYKPGANQSIIDKDPCCKA